MIMSARFSFLVLTTFHLLMISSQKVGAVKAPIANCQSVTVGAGDAAGEIFQDLQMALEALSTAGGHCFNVSISAGNHILNKFFTINSTFILRGDTSALVYVSVEVDEDFSSAASPPYALLFQNVESVEITGIQFERSPGILGFVNITEVMIENSSFRWFAQGAVDIYQCSAVQISNSNFEHNGPVSILRNNPYRGHGGGVSVGFNCDNNCDNSVRGRVSICNCRFRNNRSDPRRNVSTPASEVLRGSFPGRGGAVSVVINSTFEYNVLVTGCLIEDNYAYISGSGIYLFFTGYSPHNVTVRDTILTNNTSPLVGALSLAYVEGSDNGMKIRLEVYNSRFEENRASFGGGIFIFSGDSLQEKGGSGIGLIENCTFERNSADESGAAVSVSSQLFGTGRRIPSVTFTECIFRYNDGGRGGVVTTGYLPLTFTGSNTFSNNLGRVLVVIGTHAEVLGSLLLDGNDGIGRDGSGIDGGAIYTASFSQFELHPGGSISLLNNAGVFGAALIVDNMVAVSLPQSYRHVYNNPLCVLRYVDSTVLPDSWENVSMTFSGNHALFGSAVLISGLDFCSYPNRELQHVFRWNFTDYSNNYNTAHASNSNSSEWFVETLAVKINITTDETTAYPGKRIEVRYRGYDELDRLTASAIRLSSDGARFLFSPSVDVSQNIDAASIRTRFVDTENTYRTGEQQIMQVEALFTEVPSIDSFNLTLTPCPVGYELVSTLSKGANRDTFSCECALESNLAIMNCRESKLLIRESLWAAEAYSSETKKSLFIHQCPGEYCRYRCSFRGMVLCVTWYSAEAQNRQCSCNREGVLCGSCTNNTGFSALLNKCVECGNVNVTILAALVIADILVIGFLLVLKVGPPSWMYPTLFYVQVVPYLAEGFQRSFAPFQPYALYFSSALSLYVVYDFCLLPEASPIFMYFLRYTPFFLTVAITMAMIAFRYLNKLKRVPWYGLWWVTLLQYSHLVHTSITIFNCPKLPSLEDGHLSRRWYVDGDVECFTGFHTALSVMAIVVLTFCIAIIPVIFIYAQGYIKKPVLLSMSVSPLSAWFKEDLPWWPAMELTRRLVFVVLALVSSVIQSDFPVAFYLGLYLVVLAFVQPYRHYLYNFLDTLLTTTTLLLIVTRNTRNLIDKVQDTNIINRPQRININESRCESNYAEVIWDTLIFYYLPAVVFVLCFLVAALVTIVRLCKRQDNTDTGEEGFESVSYRLAGNTTATSNIMDTLMQGTMPMSTILRQLNRRNSDDSMSSSSQEGRRYQNGPPTLNRTQRHPRKMAKTGQTRRNQRWSLQQFSWHSRRHHLKKRLPKSPLTDTAQVEVGRTDNDEVERQLTAL